MSSYETVAVAIPPAEEGATAETITISSGRDVLSLKIRDALLSEARLGGADLHIRLDGERVTVSGTVGDDDQRELALNITGRYVGRNRVTDDIQTGRQTSYDMCEA